MSTPLKVGSVDAARNLRILLQKYPPDAHRAFWDMINADDHTTKVKPWIEYPGPLWFWSLQASGSLPHTADGKIDQARMESEDWQNWNEDGDHDQLSRFRSVATEIAQVCNGHFDDVPTNLSDMIDMAEQAVSARHSHLEEEKKRGKLTAPMVGKRMKSIRGLEHQIDYMQGQEYGDDIEPIENRL